MVHPYEDSDSSEDEVDWQDTRHDPYKAGNMPTGGVDKIRGTAQCVQYRLIGGNNVFSQCW